MRLDALHHEGVAPRAAMAMPRSAVASAFAAGEGEMMDAAAAGCRWQSRITVRMVSRWPWSWPTSDVHGLDPVASKARLPVRQLHDDIVTAAAVVSAAAA